MLQATSLRRAISVTSVLVSSAISVAVPIAYTLVSYADQTRTLALIAQLNAAELASAATPTFTFSRQRADELFVRTLPLLQPHAKAIGRRITDSTGVLAAERGEPPAWPSVARTAPLMAAGLEIGTLHIETSLRPLLAELGIVALVCLFLGLGAHFGIRIVFLRLVDRMLGEQKAQNLRFHTCLNNMSQGLCFFDGQRRLIVCNDRYADMYRLSRDLVRPGTTLAEIVEHRFNAGSFPEMTRAEYLASRNSIAIANKPTDTVMALKDGRTFAIHHRPMADGGWVATHDDITERRRTETQIEHMAHHDALTGLPNRLLLLERLRQAITFSKPESAERSHHHVGLMFIDVDRFKTINDSLGHHVGDLVLSELARRLQSVVRAGDTVARMGGDEFVIVLPQMAQAIDCETVAQKVRDAMASPVHVDTHDLTMTVSIGLATWPDMAEDASTLMSRADAAMYQAKRGGRDKWCWFEPGETDVMPTRLRLENDLRRALERDQLAVHFQPQYDCSSGALLGAEALLRWHHPELGLVPPLEFIPLAEEIGLIVPIGQWVLREALRHAVKWRAPGDAPLHVAVNLSPRQLDTEAVVSMVKDALVEFEAAPHLLELEITESAVVRNVESASGRLRQLADLGVTITIDDFGVGYSSLSYLRDLPVRKFKVDRSFVKPLPDDAGAARLVAALIAMAHQLGVGLVAEGVETDAQLAMLRQFGCEAAQGFLLGKPMDADSFAALVNGLPPHQSKHSRIVKQLPASLAER
jgi:diguanylate cyclase (GGDEF)-like protein